mmetsp:Transcript_3626/g.22702  ORF Transcript_3626/g.22702 Transcript_3626/m.22702 type:complete len:428 (-) Transcript_3626:1515-2798(-)
MNPAHWKRRKVVYAAMASTFVVGASLYVVRRAYKSQAWTDAETSLKRIRTAVSQGAKAAADVAETAATVAEETKEYVHGRSDALPASLKQCLRLVQEEDVQANLRLWFFQWWSRCAHEPTEEDNGEEQGHGRNEGFSSTTKAKGFVEMALDRLFTQEGANVVSVVLGKVAADAVQALAEQRARGGEGRTEEVAGTAEACMRLMASEKGRKVLSDIVTTFTVSAVSVYMQKTSHLNYFDRLADAISTPGHKEVMQELAGTVCRESVTAFVRTNREMPGEDTPLGPATPERTTAVRRLYATTEDQAWNKESASSLYTVGENKAAPSGSPSADRRKEEDSKHLHILLSAIREPEVRSMVREVAGAMSAEATRSFIQECWPSRRSANKSVEGISVEGCVTAASLVTQAFVAVLLLALLCMLGVHAWAQRGA